MTPEKSLRPCQQEVSNVTALHQRHPAGRVQDASPAPLALQWSASVWRQRLEPQSLPVPPGGQVHCTNCQKSGCLGPLGSLLTVFSTTCTCEPEQPAQQGHQPVFQWTALVKTLWSSEWSGPWGAASAQQQGCRRPQCRVSKRSVGICLCEARHCHQLLKLFEATSRGSFQDDRTPIFLN